MAPWKLETKQAFREALKAESPMVITDSAGSPRFHPGLCEHLTIEGFYEKVITNSGRNGAYYAVSTIAAAREEWPGVTDCFTFMT
jgi:hypothetical protein